eukprot:275074-Prymnesium_polylepis.1
MSAHETQTTQASKRGRDAHSRAHPVQHKSSSAAFSPSPPATPSHRGVRVREICSKRFVPGGGQVCALRVAPEEPCTSGGRRPGVNSGVRGRARSFRCRGALHGRGAAGPARSPPSSFIPISVPHHPSTC